MLRLRTAKTYPGPPSVYLVTYKALGMLAAVHSVLIDRPHAAIILLIGMLSGLVFRCSPHICDNLGDARRAHWRAHQRQLRARLPDRLDRAPPRGRRLRRQRVGHLAAVRLLPLTGARARSHAIG
eukprot:6213664-Pleurochrysis_carterae.AAC.5